MARKARIAAMRHRALASLALLVLVMGTTLGMVTEVGAEDIAPAEGETQEVATPEPTTPERPAAEEPAVEEPEASGPTFAAAVTAGESSSFGGSILPNSHTNPPDPPAGCQGIGVMSFESDERADRAAANDGECTYGNIGAGPPTVVLGQCVARFGSGVTHFYNSENATGTGNDDLTGAITPHPIDVGAEGTQLNITPDPGVVIDGVFVKGGNAYNTYLGNESNMIPPLAGATANFADISHYVVCYHLTQVVETGSLDVIKSIVGDAGGASFTIEVDCDEGTTHDRTVSGSDELVFNSSGVNQGPGTLPITGIPVDTTCTVTETDNGGADSVSISPNNGEVVIVADTETDVTVTNTFEADPETGSLDVIKSIVGDAGGASFTIEVDCDEGTTHDRTVSGSDELVFNSSGVNQGPGTLPITGIPVDTTCTVTETDNGGADSVSISPNNGEVVIVADTETDVTVTNTFIEVGGDITVSLNVNKEVVGDTNTADGATFVVNVSCTGSATVNENLSFVWPSGLGVQSITEQIPTDGELTCTVTETDPGGVILEGYKIDGGAIQSGAPIIVLSITRPNAAVTVVNDPSNEIEVGGISVTDALPFTGSATAILLKSAFWLLVAGSIALVITRRRRVATVRA